MGIVHQFPTQSNPTLSLSIIIGIISIVLVLISLRRRNKVKLPPSPPKLPLIGNLHQLGTLPHRSFHTLSKKYGPLMFLQLGQTPTLVVSSADVAREIVKTHDVVFSSRPQTTASKYFLYDGKDVAFATYGEEWRQKRKVCVLELLSLKRVKSYQSIRQQEVAELVGGIGEAASKGEIVNLSEMLMAASNNIVSRCVLGQKYDTPDGNSSFGELGREMTREFSSFSVRDFFPCLGWIDNLTGLIARLKSIMSALDSFFDELIAEHKRAEKSNDDFIGILLHLKQSGSLDFDLTMNDLKAILVDMFIGGSDTTSVTLEWAFSELIKKPSTMKKAQEEIRRVVGKKTKVEASDVNEMEYLKCVIKETLRLHPAIPLLVPRETTSSVKVKGYEVPSKTMVFMNAWSIHRDPELWDNPEEFIPERFENKQLDMKGLDFQYIPFGTGRRGCPGYVFALASAEYLLANLLYWFDWELPSVGGLRQDIDMSEQHGITIGRKVPLRLQPLRYPMI